MEFNKRNCFISYHHEYDGEYMDELREIISPMSVFDYSLKSDIGHLTDETIYKKVREKMRNCSVTVVLIGESTGHRKWIDWEIWASLRGYNPGNSYYKSFKPNGLLGIFLPVESYSIPNRFEDNMDSGFAVSMDWENLERDLETKVNEAYWNRTNATWKIDNSRERMEDDYRNFLGFRI